MSDAIKNVSHAWCSVSPTAKLCRCEELLSRGGDAHSVVSIAVIVAAAPASYWDPYFKAATADYYIY